MRTGAMATLTLKNVPDDLYGQLKARAASNRRSLNREAIVCLESVLGGGDVPDPAPTLARLRNHRARIRNVFLTDRALATARVRGRA